MALQPGPICWLIALVATERELFVEWSPEEIRTILAIICYAKKITLKELKAQSSNSSGGGLAGTTPVLKGYIGGGGDTPLHNALRKIKRFEERHPVVFEEQWNESKLKDNNDIYQPLKRFLANRNHLDFVVPEHFLANRRPVNGALPGHSPAPGATGSFAQGTGGRGNRQKPRIKSKSLSPPRTNVKSTRSRHPIPKPDLSPTRKAGREQRVNKSRGRPPAVNAIPSGKSTNSRAPGPSAMDTDAVDAGFKVAAPPEKAPFDGRAQNYRSTNNDDEDTDDDASKGDDSQPLFVQIPDHQSDAAEIRPSDEPQVNALLDDTLKKLKDGTIQATGNAPLFERLKDADMSNVNVVKISNTQDIWNGLMETDGRNIQRLTMQEGLNTILLYSKEGGDKEGAQKAHEDAAHVIAHSEKYQQNVHAFVQSCDLASGIYGKKNSDIDAKIEALKYEKGMNEGRLLQISKNKTFAQGMSGDVRRLGEQARLVNLAYDIRECPFDDEKWTGDEGDEEEGVLAKLFTPECDGKKLFKLPQKVSKKLKDQLTGTARGLVERFEDKVVRTDESIVASMMGKMGVSDKPKDDDVSMLGMGDALENHEARGSYDVSLQAPVNQVPSQNNTAVPGVQQQQHSQVPQAHATPSGFPGAGGQPQAPPTPGNGVHQMQDQTYPFAATTTTSARGTPQPYASEATGAPLNRNGVHHETQQPTREHQTYPNVATNAAAASATAQGIQQQQPQVSISPTNASGATAPNVPNGIPYQTQRPAQQYQVYTNVNTATQYQPQDSSAQRIPQTYAYEAPGASYGAPNQTQQPTLQHHAYTNANANANAPTQPQVSSLWPDFSGLGAAQQGDSNGSNATEYPVQQQRQPPQPQQNPRGAPSSSGGMLDGAMSFLKKLNRKK